MALLLGHRLACVRGGRVVFREINFSLQRGGILLLHGPNGSGKSTLLRVIAGLLDPTEGSLFYRGRDVTGSDPSAYIYRQKINYVNDTTPILEDSTVWENMMHMNHMYMQVPLHLIEEAVVRAGLEKILHKRCTELSLGQKRRMNIARMIACVNRPIWLLDEPIIGIDVNGVSYMSRKTRLSFTRARRLHWLRNSSSSIVRMEAWW